MDGIIKLTDLPTPRFGTGLLGVEADEPAMLMPLRLEEIERRILAIEERLGRLDDPLGRRCYTSHTHGRFE